METEAAPVATGKKKDVYALITERIIEQLEKGTVPWRKPWTDSGVPKNLITMRPYRGINIMLLASYGYDQNLFLTFKQLKKIGGKVKKDEKGHPVVFWDYGNTSSVQQDEDEAITEEKPIKKAVLTYYMVFNIAQCDGIPLDLIPAPWLQEEPIVACEKIVKNMQACPPITFKEEKAYYDPLRDIVNMPKRKSFASNGSYYATLFHELVHSTGHHARLNRPDLIQMSEFGSEPYSKEELVAEIGSSFLQSLSGITDQFEQSTAYIQGWLQKLRNDRHYIFTASTQAQKATDYILNVKDEREQDEVGG